MISRAPIAGDQETAETAPFDPGAADQAAIEQGV